MVGVLHWMGTRDQVWNSNVEGLTLILYSLSLDARAPPFLGGATALERQA